MEYYVTTTIGESKIKSEPFATLAEAQKAKEALTTVAQMNHFGFTWEIEVEGLFSHYQDALIMLPSCIPDMDEDKWVQTYKELKKFLLADIEGDFRAGFLTTAEYEKLIKISNILDEV